MAQRIKNVFTNQDLMGWLNGLAIHQNQICNEVAKAYKGDLYHVGTVTYIQAVQLMTDIDQVKKLINIDINGYRNFTEKNSKFLFTEPREAARGIWYEFGLYTSALDTIFRLLEVIHTRPDVFKEKGTIISPKESYEAGKAFNFYVDAFNKFRDKCFKELTDEEASKYYRFID